MKAYDCVVIGGGPAGVTAALYLLRSGATIAFIEKLSPGGQVLMTESVENYPGFPQGVKGYELVDLFAAHLDSFEFDRYNDEVTAIEHAPGKNVIRFGDEAIQAKSVILCAGAVFRSLGLHREQELTGRGVSYCALCDGNFFRDQVVGVVGGGNTALEESLYLAKLVKRIHLIHRRDEFRGALCYQEKCLIHPKITVEKSSVVKSLVGEDQLTGVVLEDTKTGETRELPLDGLFIFIGYKPVTAFVPKGLDLDQGFIKTDAEMRTNLPGIFAAGDVRAKLCRQVATAVGDGATAANSAFLYLENLA